MVRLWRNSAAGGGYRRLSPAASDWRFRGTITGLGTTSGTRIVIGDWSTSPFGAFADVMVEQPGGHRILLAPSAEVADFVSSTYAFDEVVKSAVEVRRERRWMLVKARPLVLQAQIGQRTILGWLLRSVPASVATDPRWLDLIAPMARRLVPGVHVRGSAGGDREEWYGATDVRGVIVATASWHGVDLGTLARVEPPTRFGFSSPPSRPASVTLVTTVRPRASADVRTEPR